MNFCKVYVRGLKLASVLKPKNNKMENLKMLELELLFLGKKKKLPDIYHLSEERFKVAHGSEGSVHGFLLQSRSNMVLFVTKKAFR